MRHAANRLHSFLGHAIALATTSITVRGLMLVLALTVGSGTAAFGEPNADDNQPPSSFIDHDPSLKGTHIWAPAAATSGQADPGRALKGEAVAMLSGHGPGCTPLSPCADVLANHLR